MPPFASCRSLAVASTLCLAASACGSSPSTGADAGPDAAVDGGAHDAAPAGTTVSTVAVPVVNADAPITFGHPFRAGDVPAGAGLALRRSDGRVIPLQIDRPATWPDKSLRFAVLSGVLPSGTAGSLALVTAPTPAAAPGPSLATLLAGGFDATATVTVGGAVYTASAKDLLGQQPTRWLDGPAATEWNVHGPLTSSAGPHPHLTARFDVRAYAGIAGERVDITVENDDAFGAEPQNFTYDVDLAVRGQNVFHRTGVVHYHHARWHQRFGLAPVEATLDRRSLEQSGAVPTYDPGLIVSAAALADWDKRTPAVIEPCSTVIVEPYMPSTGGRPDIGILPAWAAAYVVSGDPRARRAVMATGDIAGSFAVHYRDTTTDRAVSLVDYPDLTILGNPGDTKHPFPTCATGGSCSTGMLTADSAHQPSMAYLPYLLTGDRFYFEELAFWGDYNIFQDNPAYRNYEKGWLDPDQVRGMAWSLRTFGHLAFVAPDGDPAQAYFSTLLDSNLDHLATVQVMGASTNALGVNTLSHYAIVYDNNLGLAPWQDDFFTSALGALVGMGFAKAAPVLTWKALSPVGRMLDMCWIEASAYSLDVRATASGPLYGGWAEVYQANFGSAVASDGSKLVDQPCGSAQMAAWLTKNDKNGRTWAAGEMSGYSTSPTGYPANLQPALAAAVDAGAPRAADAWKLFQGRALQPALVGDGDSYATQPQFAIVPRH